MQKIEEVPSDNEELLELINTHSIYCQQRTPPNSGHAVSAEKSDLTSIRYWLAYKGGCAVGCIGLKLINPHHLEVKTMHVLADVRGQGVGAALLRVLIDETEKLGATRLSLETGRGEGFEASRQLYRKLGFAPCEPFGNYAADPFSYCMTQELGQ